jgi:hypothetical protein
VFPLNEGTSEIIIRNAISNINMTIHSDLERNRHIEEDGVTFLGNLINEKKKWSLNEEYEDIMGGGNTHNAGRLKTFSFDSTDNINQVIKVNLERKDSSLSGGYELSDDHAGLKRRLASPNLSPGIKRGRNPERPSILTNLHSNVIFQQLINLISGQDFKFYPLENTHQIEDYIKSLDNTPVYYTFNCGVIYVPYKGKRRRFNL